MKDEGPALEALLHCLAQCPADLVEHCGQSTSLTTALVCDYFRRHEPQLMCPSWSSSCVGAVPDQFDGDLDLVLGHHGFMQRRDLVPACKSY